MQLQNVPNIDLVLTPYFPVPVTMGGAVESLVELLILQNEISARYRFNVFCVYDDKAYRESKKFKYTKFIYFKNNKYAKVKYFFYKVFRKMFHIHIMALDEYHSMVFSCVKKDIHVQNAKKYNKPIVLSTIYWPTQEFEKKSGELGIRGFLGSIMDINMLEHCKALAKYFILNEKNEATILLMKKNIQICKNLF